MRSVSGEGSLRAYQKQGVAWLVSRLATHKAALLADEAGLGKTLEALETARQIKADRILIVCPAGARRVWSGEIARWSPDWSDWVVLYEPGGQKDQPRWINNLAPVIFIVSYDELSNRKSPVANWLRLIRWDLLILDEAHYLKNPSNRTHAVYGRRGDSEGLQACAEHVILLTGTPTPNHAGELWQHYRTFWPEAFGKALTQAQFEDRFTRYRDTVFGRQVTGSKNQAVLRAALHEMVLRRRKDEVLKELPSLRLQDIPLELTAETRALLSPETRQLETALQGRSDAEVLRRLHSVGEQPLASVRRELGELKTQAAIFWLQERLASTDKILVFAWHRKVIARLRCGLLQFHPVVVTGDTPGRLRAAAIDEFQNRPEVRIFVGQILAAGTAITLTAANEVAIVEPSWVPGENHQAICRAHRLGQRDSVLASFLYLPGTLDQRIIQVFRRKAAEISELQGDDDESDAQLRHRSANRIQNLSDVGGGPTGVGNTR